MIRNDAVPLGATPVPNVPVCRNPACMPSESDVHLDTPESASDGARSPRTLRPFILAGHPRRVQVRDLLTEYPGRQPSTVIILRRLGS